MTELEKALAELDVITEFRSRGMEIYLRANAHLVEARKVVELAAANNDVLDTQFDAVIDKVRAATAASIEARKGYVS